MTFNHGSTTIQQAPSTPIDCVSYMNELDQLVDDEPGALHSSVPTPTKLAGGAA